MRLDQFLTAVGLVKRRTAAKQACVRGEVELDGRPAKGGDRVAAGQRLRLRLGWRQIEAVVLDTPQGSVPKRDRGKFVAVIREEAFGEQDTGDQGD